MKRLFAILLLSIYLFNLAGYSLFYQYHINLTDEHQLSRIEKNDFRDDELREIKIPINLPYYNSTVEFERIDGAVEVNGQQYNYVKRRVSGDTLYLLCLPNEDKTQLYKDKHSYASATNDLPNNNKEESGVKKNGFSNEYIESNLPANIILPGFRLTGFYAQPDSKSIAGYPGVSGQPPEQV